ncbi:MAG: hypothetical protein AB4050_02245 [Synechococcus sp.]
MSSALDVLLQAWGGSAWERLPVTFCWQRLAQSYLDLANASRLMGVGTIAA